RAEPRAWLSDPEVRRLEFLDFRKKTGGDRRRYAATALHFFVAPAAFAAGVLRATSAGTPKRCRTGGSDADEGARSTGPSEAIAELETGEPGGLDGDGQALVKSGAGEVGLLDGEVCVGHVEQVGGGGNSAVGERPFAAEAQVPVLYML